MFKLPMEEKRGPVEVDASTLGPDEWFVVYALRGLAPDSNLDRIAEFRKRSFAMTPAQKHLSFRSGVESLMARGLIGPVTNADGSPQTDAEGNVVYEVKGKLVYRVKQVSPPSLSNT